MNNPPPQTRDDFMMVPTPCILRNLRDAELACQVCQEEHLGEDDDHPYRLPCGCVVAHGCLRSHTLRSRICPSCVPRVELYTDVPSVHEFSQDVYVAEHWEPDQEEDTFPADLRGHNLIHDQGDQAGIPFHVYWDDLGYLSVRYNGPPAPVQLFLAAHRAYENGVLNPGLVRAWLRQLDPPLWRLFFLVAYTPAMYRDEEMRNLTNDVFFWWAESVGFNPIMRAPKEGDDHWDEW